MDLALFFILAAAYIGLVVWAVTRQKKWTLVAAVYLVLFGLIYDNGIIALGKFIGEGALLENLNAMRYWIHALLTPALVLFSLGALRAAGVDWARKSWALYSAIALFILGVVIEIWQVTWGTELAPVREYGVLKYASTEEAGGTADNDPIGISRAVDRRIDRLEKNRMAMDVRWFSDHGHRQQCNDSG
ncbi:hypothetical protein [Planomicrobium okeanokoites]|uniref:hypothetical protein n=1 Tax=Planomicrobium okeanokoites TaxID=244 RepID=UPI0030F68E05